MAVSKLWAVKSNLGKVIDYANNPKKTRNPKYTEEQYQALADVIAYAKDEEKTEKQFFVEGINCNPVSAREQFVTTKQFFGQTDGIQAYHGYLSFKEQDITPELAQQVGMEFARRVWGNRFQVVVTCHLNTHHLHCHFVINSISFVDGKRLWGNEKRWYYFRHVADEICKEYGLYFNPKPKFERPTNYYYDKLEKAGMPHRYTVIREVIDYALEHSKNMLDFQDALKDMGYGYNFNPRIKYWTVKPPGYTKAIRLYRLGDDYTNEAITNRLGENRNRIGMHRYTRLTVASRQYRLPTRGDKIRKIGGLYGMYLYYCYRLGKLPRYRKLNSAQIHYYFKEELLKLDELSAQTRLLGKHGIQTDEQLFQYKSSVEDEIKSLTADRTHLRKITRRKIDDVELSQAKEKISQITEKLRSLRKEVKLCEGIAERSGVMKDNLDKVLAEEDKNRRKESRKYEQRR